MPETHDPRRSRGNAGKQGLRRSNEKKPYWPGLDLNGNYAVDTNNNNNNDDNQQNNNEIPQVETTEAALHHPMDDDPILSFDNDPPTNRIVRNRVNNNDTSVNNDDDLVSSSSPQQRPFLQTEPSLPSPSPNTTNDSITTADSNKPSPGKRRRLITTRSTTVAVTTTTTSNNVGGESSQESYNKITEIVPTRGTRSGRHFHNSIPSPADGEEEKGKEKEDKITAEMDVNTASTESVAPTSTEGTNVDPTAAAANSNEIPMDVEQVDDVDAAIAVASIEKGNERRVSFQQQVSSNQNSVNTSSTHQSTLTGKRRRRKRKRDLSVVNNNTQVDPERTPQQQSNELEKSEKLQKQPNVFSFNTDENEVANTEVNADENVMVNTDASLTSRTNPVENATTTTTTDARTPPPPPTTTTVVTTTTSASTTNERFIQLARSIAHEHLPVIGDTLKHVWESLLTVVPGLSPNTGTTTSPMSLSQTNPTTNPNPDIEFSKKDQKELLTNIFDRQEELIQKMNELEERNRQEREQQAKRYEERISILSKKLQEKEDENVQLQIQLKESEGNDKNLQQRLQDKQELLDEVRRSTVNVQRHANEQSQQLKIKDKVILSQDLELKRSREEISNLRELNRNLEAVNYNGPRTAVAASAPSSPIPARTNATETVQPTGAAIQNRLDKLSNPKSLLKKKSSKATSLYRRQSPRRLRLEDRMRQVETEDDDVDGNEDNDMAGVNTTTIRRNNPIVSSLKVSLPPDRFVVRLGGDDYENSPPVKERITPRNNRKGRRNKDLIAIDSP